MDLNSKRAVLYLRISDEKQIGNTSLEVQDQFCKDFCKRQNLKIVDVIRLEAVSAKYTNQQRVNELVSYSKKNRNNFDVLVVYKLSRFARSVKQHYQIKNELEKYGIVLSSASETIDTTPIGRFTENSLAAFYQLDNDIRRENTVSGMSERIRQGLWRWRLTWGYCSIRKPGEPLLPAVKDASLSPHIKDIFELYSRGIYTFLHIARLMNQKVVIDRNGKRYSFSKQTVYKILTNKYYCGLLHNPFDGFDYSGKHEPLISMKLWKKVQDILTGKSKSRGRIRLNDNPEFPLRGNLFAECGCKFTACKSRGQSKYFDYYLLRHTCGIHETKSFQLATTHEGFQNYLKEITPSEEATTLFLAQVLEKLQDDIQRHESQLRSAKNRLQQLEIRQKRLLEAYLDEDITKEAFEHTNQRMQHEFQELNLLLSQESETELSVNSLSNSAKQFLTTIDSRYKKGSLAKKKLILNAVFPEGIIFDGNSYRTPKLPLVFHAISSVIGPKNFKCDPTGNRTRIFRMKT